MPSAFDQPPIKFNEHIEADGPTVFAHTEHRVETQGLDLPLRPLARLAQVEESGLRGVEREAEKDWGR
jgi:hypothetical protein